MEPKYEYVCVLVDSRDPQAEWKQVGIGPDENLWRIENDYHAWRADGYSVEILKRVVGTWEPL